VSDIDLTLAMAYYEHVADLTSGRVVGLPVFPSRVFRHSGIYVRAGDVTEPAQLRGKRIGVPEWAQAAAVYSRALLAHEWGVPLTEIDCSPRPSARVTAFN